MKKKGIKGMIDKLNEPNNLLSGIYNYCDSWCERCSFSDRCINFSTREEYNISENNDEKSIEASLNSAYKMFEDLVDFLKEEADKKGINLTEEVDTTKYESAKDKAYSHPLSNKSYKYFHLVRDWFKSREDIVTKQADEFMKFAELGLNEEKLENNVHIFQESMEVIQWYFTLIRVKIIRALLTKYDSTYEDSEFKFEQVNTSAKIALIGCEKSLSAWKTMYDFLTEDEDKILQILSYLDNLIKEIKIEFPEVKDFKRPYFD